MVETIEKNSDKKSEARTATTAVYTDVGKCVVEAVVCILYCTCASDTVFVSVGPSRRMDGKEEGPRSIL